jgi:hypothetical protein
LSISIEGALSQPLIPSLVYLQAMALPFGVSSGPQLSPKN